MSSLLDALCPAAAAAGKLEVLVWLRSQDVPWGEETCLAAAKAGHRFVLEWAVNNGCPWSRARCKEGTADPATLAWLDAYDEQERDRQLEFLRLRATFRAAFPGFSISLVDEAAPAPSAATCTITTTVPSVGTAGGASAMRFSPAYTTTGGYYPYTSTYCLN